VVDCPRCGGAGHLVRIAKNFTLDGGKNLVIPPTVDKRPEIISFPAAKQEMRMIDLNMGREEKKEVKGRNSRKSGKLK
jgi:hypothetical protein